jgi:arginase family enzyme
LGPLEQGQSKILWRHELYEPEKLANFFEAIKQQINDQTTVVFSLDADALNGSDMPGVSAVNGNGLSRAELNQIWKLYSELPYSHRRVIGIYELNPVYDTLSMLSMRTLGTFLYDCI